MGTPLRAWEVVKTGLGRPRAKTVLHLRIRHSKNLDGIEVGKPAEIRLSLMSSQAIPKGDGMEWGVDGYEAELIRV